MTHAFSSCTKMIDMNQILSTKYDKRFCHSCTEVWLTLSWWSYVHVSAPGTRLINQFWMFLPLYQIRHAAANVLRECWLLHRTNLTKGNRGEQRRHQRFLLEAIRVWVTVSQNDTFRQDVCVFVSGRGTWVVVCVPYVCILRLVNLVSTCLTTESQFLMANLDY